MKKATLQDAIKEIRREVQLRERLYPQWIASGKLNKAAAERQLTRMKYALELLEGNPENLAGQQQELFK
ncbi:MAG: hypothetical protein KDD01_26970 [Phaeodactylibacter sp.]|nr:hypothetical protein [Phaeodactylibacter sp.]